MAQILELADKYFKGAIMHIFLKKNEFSELKKNV